MGKPRACDVCSLRKIRCNGEQPCLPCVKAQFDCSYAKKPLKPGPKGPRATTSNRIRKKLQDIRTQAGDDLPNESTLPSCSTTTTTSPHSVDNSLDWRGNSPPRSVPASTGPSSITFNVVCSYLKIYHHRMYPIWPVIDKELLVAQLGPDMKDPEMCALAFSVCAATGAQLRLGDYESSSGIETYTVVDRFAAEAQRFRTMVDSKEVASLASILVPFFLSMYYSSRRKRFTSTLLLREALTLCELLDLDKEATYATLDQDEQRYRRKIFWLLFITERGTAMQYDMATILRNTITMPEPDDDKDPVVFAGFLSLVHLFVAVEGTLVGGGPGEERSGFTSDIFAQLQQKLRNESAMPASSNEVQRTDITITQHWMRMLAWQLSMKKISLTTGPSEDPLSLTYPAHVAKEALGFLSGVSIDSVVAHGPGMEVKIFEIANTLLDVINCVPSLTGIGPALMTQGPRDIFHGLSCLLASLSGGQSKSLTLLQGKMAESQVPFMPIPRFVEIKEESTTTPLSDELTTSLSAQSTEFPFTMQEWSPPPPSMHMVPKHENCGGGWSEQRFLPPELHAAGYVPYNPQPPNLGLASGITMDWAP